MRRHTFSAKKFVRKRKRTFVDNSRSDGITVSTLILSSKTQICTKEMHIMPLGHGASLKEINTNSNGF